MTEFLVTWLAGTPSYAMPLLLASLGLILSERAGVLNLSAEGIMAVGAMTAAVTTLLMGHPWLGLLAGAGAGIALSAVFGLAVVVFRVDQILAGLATVAIGIGITGVIGRPYVHQTVTGIDPVQLPVLSAIPVIGPVLFHQDPLFYLAVVLALMASWMLARTRFGLRWRAVGEDPAAADIAGVDVQVTQLLAVLASGALCGLAGGYLSVVSSQVWVEGMVAGRGWIAIGLVLFVRWSPVRAIFGALLFGGASALTPRLLATGANVPVYLMMMLPYLLTIAVLAIPAMFKLGRGPEPENLGTVYLRQDRR